MEDNPFIAEFSNRLYSLRQKKGVSARDMSLSLGQAHNYINGIESVKSFPSMLNFFYICEYLGITPREFFDYAEENPRQCNELFEEIKMLDGKTAGCFIDLIHEFNKKASR
jgi:transcriptional regulator with XRE-family HTH domain